MDRILVLLDWQNFIHAARPQSPRPRGKSNVYGVAARDNVVRGCAQPERSEEEVA